MIGNGLGFQGRSLKTLLVCLSGREAIGFLHAFMCILISFGVYEYRLASHFCLELGRLFFTENGKKQRKKARNNISTIGVNPMSIGFVPFGVLVICLAYGRSLVYSK